MFRFFRKEGPMLKTSASLSVQYDNPFAPFSGEDWRKGLAWVRASGFDAVELIVSDPKLLDLSSLQQALQSNGLPVSTISTGQAMSLEGIELCAASEAVRLQARRRLFEDIDFSAALGRPNVTIGLIRGRGGKLNEQMETDLLLRELCEVAAYARENGVTLNLEPINRYECKRVNSTEDGYRMLQLLGFPANVGILYDTFHSNIEDPGMLDAVNAYAAHISHVHLADSNRRLPGEGHIDFPGILRALEQNGYGGYVSLEVLNLPSAEHIIKQAGETVRRFVCIR